MFHLLAEASEIEHTLMCSYLYAAFSLKNAVDGGFSEKEADAVERWRKAIMSVATEEMGHLLIVANLTVAIGGRPHLSRPNFPVNPGYFPSGVILRLTPFSFQTLEHFIFLERPTGVDADDGLGFESTGPKREQAHQGLMPSAQDYSTVSHLYEAIRANLKAFIERSSLEALFVGPETGQIGPEAIRIHGIESCVTWRAPTGPSISSSSRVKGHPRTGRTPITGDFNQSSRNTPTCWRKTRVLSLHTQLRKTRSCGFHLIRKARSSSMRNPPPHFWISPMQSMECYYGFLCRPTRNRRRRQRPKNSKCYRAQSI